MRTAKLRVFLTVIGSLMMINIMSLFSFIAQSEELEDRTKLDQNLQLHISNSSRTREKLLYPAVKTLQKPLETNSTLVPFRFYIYNLPPSLNREILDVCDRNCFDFSTHGMGTKLFDKDTNSEKDALGFYNTNQFNLEVIIHEKLKSSPLRTNDPELADLFYVPAYIGLLCLHFDPEVTKARVLLLKDFLLKSKYFNSGKPHFSTVAKIEREMTTDFCPYLMEPFTNKISFLSIEKEIVSPDLKSTFPYSYMHKNSILLAPYPSYGHFQQSKETSLSTTPVHDREVFILLPVGETTTNSQRSKLINQFATRTKLPYHRFKLCHENGTSQMVLYYVTECKLEKQRDLIGWMQNSVFCLQPPGDSPSRKSFYDSIMTGCIPVILTAKGKNNPYAFTETINYDAFSILIKMEQIVKYGHRINHVLQDISKDQIQKMQNNLRQIAQYLQYSVPNGKMERENDALRLVFQTLAKKFKLQYDKVIDKFF